MRKILFTFLLIILSTFSCLFGMPFNEKNALCVNQTKFLKCNEFDYVCEFNGDSNFKYEYFNVGKTHSLNINNEKIKADLLMPKESAINDKIFNINTQLKKEEVAISKNLMDYYNLKIGDKVQIANAFFDDYVNATIKETLPVCYALKSETLNKNRGVVLVGYDATLNIENYTKFSFIKDEEFNNPNIAIKYFKDKKVLINQYKYNIFINCLIVLSICMLSNIPFIIIFMFLNNSLIKNNVIHGEKISKIYFKKYGSILLFSLINSFINIIFYNFMNIFYYSCSTFSFLSLITIIPFFINMFGCFLDLKIKLRRL